MIVPDNQFWSFKMKIQSSKTNTIVFLLLPGLSFAAESSNVASNKVQDIDVKAVIVNKNMQLTIKNTYSAPLMIDAITQYTNNDNACAIATTNYLIKPESDLNIFPFTMQDMAKCQKEIYIFKRYSNAAIPQLVNLYGSLDFTLKDYLNDWGAYIAAPVVIKVSYSVNNITGQKSYVEYYLYKINE